MRRNRFAIRKYRADQSAHEPSDLPKPRGRTKEPTERMNKGEARYASVLEARRLAGHVAAWWFEPFNWRMAENTYYRGDFLVMLADGTLEMHEVKGRRGDSFWAEEDAKLKLKIVAEQMPWPVIVVWEDRDRHWREKRIGPADVERAA